jgi:hypothetical protein
VRKSHLRTGGPVGIETLEKQRQRLLRPAPEDDCAGLIKQAHGVPPRKTLFGHNADLILSAGPELCPKPAMVEHPTEAVQSEAEGERVGELVAQLTRLPGEVLRPVRVAQVPQRRCQVSAGGDGGILTGDAGPKPRLLDVLSVQSVVRS